MSWSDRFEAYIEAVADILVEHEPFPTDTPPFFRARYDLHRIRVADGEFTGVFLKSPGDFSPAAFEKHMRQLPSEMMRHYLVVSEALPSYVRNRMVKRRIPFVVPNVQMFWPELGMAVRARVEMAARREIERLGPAAQTTLIHALAGKLRDEMVGREMAAVMGYSAMTMTRALNELETVGLGRRRKIGRTKTFEFASSRKALWDMARQYLRSPVLNTRVLPLVAIQPLNFLRAGESALAEVSMLSPPIRPVFAISRDTWNSLKAVLDVENLPDTEDECDLQVWAYEPVDLDGQGRVEPYSLVLSFDHETDERVALAVDEVVEAMF